MVICLERGTDLHMAQLVLLPHTVSGFSKILIGFTFLVPTHPGSTAKRAVCVCEQFAGRSVEATYRTHQRHTETGSCNVVIAIQWQLLADYKSTQHKQVKYCSVSLAWRKKTEPGNWLIHVHTEQWWWRRGDLAAVQWNKHYYYYYYYTTTIYRTLFQDNLGKPVPER